MDSSTTTDARGFLRHALRLARLPYDEADVAALAPEFVAFRREVELLWAVPLPFPTARPDASADR